MTKKIIIPNYVALVTSERKLKGFYLASDFNHFEHMKNTNEKFVYFVDKEKIEEKDEEYDFKSSHYSVKNDIWKYSLRKLGVTFSFKYNFFKRYFKYNALLGILPFRVNITHPVGEYLADIISLDLAINNIFIINGVSFKKNDKVYVFCAPSLNGKSSFLKRNKNDIEVISDDYVLVDFNKMLVSVTPLIDHDRKNQTHVYPVEVVDFFINATNQGTKSEEHSIKDFLALISMHYYENIFTKNLIFYHKLGNLLQQALEKISRMDAIKIHSVTNYNYEKYFRS